MASTQVLKSPDPLERGSQLNLPPRIVSNRRQLDDRFPVLGFTIFSDRPGYYEVLLATNPAQLVVSGTRNPSVSYSSRQDSGLIPITLGTSVYLAPAAVLRSFVQAQPRPTQIYYTVILYADQTGTRGIYAQPLETLATSAPSVAISQHFGSDGFGDILGMKPDRMRRVMPSASQGWTTSLGATNAAEDRGEGEDGTTAPPLPALSRATDAGGTYENAYQASAGESDYAEEPYAAAAQDNYDDGYVGEPRPDSSLGLSLAQQSSYRAGESEPSVLEDSSVDDDSSSSGSYRSAAAGDATQQRAASAPSRQAAYLDDDDDDDDDSYHSSARLYAAGGGGGGKGEARFYAAAAQPDVSGEETCRAAPAVAAAYGDEADLAPAPPPYQSLEAPFQSLDAPPGKASVPLTIEAKRDLIGKLGDYSALRADAEYNGVYGPEHPAYQHYHLGLSFGIALFNQERGDLGKLLDGWHERDAAKFTEVFGKDAEALLRVTKAVGPSSAESPNGKSPRLQPVNGADLWQEPWLSRFREAGSYKPFQAVQNKLAAELYLDPMLHFAHWVGLKTERGLAILMDRAAELGVGPAQQWVMNAVGPFQTSLQRHQALAALGYDSIRAFQNAHPGTDTNGQWEALTHAAAVAELRHKGNSPVPLPTVEQMLDTLVRRSARTPSFERVRALRNDPRFADTPFEMGREHKQ